MSVVEAEVVGALFLADKRQVPSTAAGPDPGREQGREVLAWSSPRTLLHLEMFFRDVESSLSLPFKEISTSYFKIRGQHWI